MRAFCLLSAYFLIAAGTAFGVPSDDKAPTTPQAAAAAASTTPTLRLTPPVLRNADKEDTNVLVLPSIVTVPMPAPERAETPATPSAPPAPDPDKPVIRRTEPTYPSEFAAESAIFCQKQIGEWTEADAIELLGDPKRHRSSVNQGSEDGDIFAFADPSSRYREIELDFDRESGALRAVFAYPWKLTWADCRKNWGGKVTAADADKGRIFYSYVDRRMDVLVDATGKVISLGLY
jgi:hypothetical protein